jgi:hypothetical protein
MSKGWNKITERKRHGSSGSRLVCTETQPIVQGETVKPLAERAHEPLITALTFHFRCKLFKTFKSAICCRGLFLYRNSAPVLTECWFHPVIHHQQRTGNKVRWSYGCELRGQRNLFFGFLVFFSVEGNVINHNMTESQKVKTFLFTLRVMLEALKNAEDTNNIMLLSCLTTWYLLAIGQNKRSYCVTHLTWLFHS